ncbi:serine/threonine protein kinase [Streptomyces sp. 5-8]|uniref:Serine/threonine protein kinase n=1 Tax=Streptomyces musisoli TaxID=2802280 RepID=A0ABS1P008_9ACTN|nr:serine/threonine-protein kinase [Streptomyces musisoli]MBL1105495.1 serine/threonine protein kinase [Streptomyces musisoli]
MQPLEVDEPATVGPYRLLGRLGSGGMGRVYLGRSAGGRTVAVKIVHPHFALDEEFRARFRREVEAARRVGGAWTAPVLDADPGAPVPWVATAYAAGPSLAAAVGDAGPMPAHTVRALGAGLAEALTAVHEQGLVHRDVKPSNVLLTLDGPLLIDFGIARAMDGTASLTSTGVSIGSPGYMSPEQILGKGVTGAADVFSLGAVLAYAATGEPPFRGDSSAALLYKVVHEEPELGGLDGELRELAAACLTKDPAARPGPAEVSRRLAPDGAARLVAGGWLPGTLVEQVSRSAVRLLNLDTEETAPSGPVTFTSPSTTGPPTGAGPSTGGQPIPGPSVGGPAVAGSGPSVGGPVAAGPSVGGTADPGSFMGWGADPSSSTGGGAVPVDGSSGAGGVGFGPAPVMYPGGGTAGGPGDGTAGVFGSAATGVDGSPAGAPAGAPAGVPAGAPAGVPAGATVVPGPRDVPPPGRVSVNVTAASAPAEGGQGRRVSCTVVLAVAGALAAVSVGIGFLVRPWADGGGSDTAAGGGTTRSPAPGVTTGSPTTGDLPGGVPTTGGPTPGGSSAGSPSAGSPTAGPGAIPDRYLGTWEGQAAGLGGSLPMGTFRVTVRQAAVGEELGRLRQTDQIGAVCTDILTLKKVTRTQILATSVGAAGNHAGCNPAPHQVELTPAGDDLTYTSDSSEEGNPTSRMSRVD